MRTLPALALLAACAPAGDSAAPGGSVELGQQAADFLLEDLNLTSPRAGDAISPRDYLGEVSGWYFIHST